MGFGIGIRGLTFALRENTRDQLEGNKSRTRYFGIGLIGGIQGDKKLNSKLGFQIQYLNSRNLL